MLSGRAVAAAAAAADCRPWTVVRHIRVQAIPLVSCGQLTSRVSAVGADSGMYMCVPLRAAVCMVRLTACRRVWCASTGAAGAERTVDVRPPSGDGTNGRSWAGGIWYWWCGRRAQRRYFQAFISRDGREKRDLVRWRWEYPGRLETRPNRGQGSRFRGQNRDRSGAWGRTSYRYQC